MKQECCILERKNNPYWNKTRMLLFGMQQEQFFLEQNKTLRTILFGTKQERSFLEMGKSSSNVPKEFEGSALTGQADIENRGGYLLHSLLFVSHGAYSKI